MRSESARKARIGEIASQIAELSDELKSLILEDEQSNIGREETSSTSGTTSVRHISSRASSGATRFRIGDRIVITNNYKGHFGHTGTVTKIDKENDWVHFHQDSPSLRTKRKSYNIRHLD